ARGGGGRRRQLRGGRLRAGARVGRLAAGGVLQRARQPGEGRRRPEHSGLQRDDGLRREAHPRRAGPVAMNQRSPLPTGEGQGEGIVRATAWYVIKIGGELATDRALLAASVGRAISAFLSRGVRVAIIHGGGPQANE